MDEFLPAHEEQGQKTLLSHWQIWVKDLPPQVPEDIWNSDPDTINEAKKAFYNFVDKVMNATYSKQLSFNHNCEES